MELSKQGVQNIVQSSLTSIVSIVVSCFVGQTANAVSRHPGDVPCCLLIGQVTSILSSDWSDDINTVL